MFSNVFVSSKLLLDTTAFKSLFAKAVEMNIIKESQQEMLNGFFENPDETMRNFLKNHPEFLEESLNSDEKTAKRAKLLVEGNLYNLN